MNRITDYVAKLKLDTKGAFKAVKALDSRVLKTGGVVKKTEVVATGSFKAMERSVKRINGRLGRTPQRLDEIRARARRIRFSRAIRGAKKLNDTLREARFLAGGIAAAGALAFKSLVGKGSELQESITAVQATFGGASASVLQFGKDATDSVLLSRRAFNDSAVELAPFLKNAGLKDEDLNKVLFEVIQRAADTASVLGKDVGEILTKFKAGLSGEAEPLKALGVFVSASALQQQALAQGITKSVAKMTEQEKVGLRLNAIMAQTADKAGDVAKNFDSVAIQTQRQSAQVENLAGDFGQNLQPAMQSILRVTGKVLDKFNGLTEEQQDNIIKMGLWTTGIAAAVFALSFVGPVVTGVTLLVSGLSVALGVLTTIAGAVATGIGVVVAAVGIVPIAIGAAVIAVAGLAYAFRDELWGAIQFVWDKMKAFFKFLIDNPLTRILGKIASGVSDIFTADAEIPDDGRPTGRRNRRNRSRGVSSRDLDSLNSRSNVLSPTTNVGGSKSVEIKNDIKVTSPNPIQAGNEISRVVSADIALGFAT